MAVRTLFSLPCPLALLLPVVWVVGGFDRRHWCLSAFIVLVVLGTGWAIEKASSNSHRQGGAAVSEPAKASDAETTPLSREPLDVQPAATDSEYDRSDLILSQG